MKCDAAKIAVEMEENDEYEQIDMLCKCSEKFLRNTMIHVAGTKYRKVLAPEKIAAQ